MIVIFGPAGAGKSMQGQMLAARRGWRWLSAGQLLRDTKDPQLTEIMHAGDLAPHAIVVRIMGEAIKRAGDIDKVILDGFPRELDQAKWLLDSQPEHGRSIDVAIVLEVPRDELLKRLSIRGRIDDTPEAIDNRLHIYRQEMYPILGLFTENKIPVVHIDGVGSVGEVHDKIYNELENRGLVG